MAESLVGTVVAALTAGAVAAGKDTASQAVKDTYSGLKSLVKRRFDGKASAEVALAEAENDPETWAMPLTKAVSEHATDGEIVALARQMLEMLQDQQESRSKYSTNIGNAQGTVIGDNAQVTQTFNNPTQNRTDQPGQG